MFKIILLSVFAYALGSVPFGIIFTKLFAHTDIRQQGSGNIGTANVVRNAGLIAGILTLVGDVLKGALPVYFALNNNFNEIYVSIIVLCAFLGHLYPVFLKFRYGGKGVATAGGCFLAVSPFACVIAVFVFLVFVSLFKRSSVGSLAASATLPIAVWQFENSIIITECAIIIAILIYLRHIDNIKRLLNRAEPTLWG